MERQYLHQGTTLETCAIAVLDLHQPCRDVGYAHHLIPRSVDRWNLTGHHTDFLGASLLVDPGADWLHVSGSSDLRLPCEFALCRCVGPRREVAQSTKRREIRTRVPPFLTHRPMLPDDSLVHLWKETPSMVASPTSCIGVVSGGIVEVAGRIENFLDEVLTLASTNTVCSRCVSYNSESSVSFQKMEFCCALLFLPAFEKDE